MAMPVGYARTLLAACCAALLLAACRQDPSTIDSTPTTDQFGNPGAGYIAQCSGWFPDWIARNPPPSATSFQLSQGYPLGTPVFGEVDGQTRVIRWDPPAPATGPWSAHDFRVAAQRPAYLDALKEYFLAGMIDVDFVAQKNRTRRWYHVPMMTTDPFSRREPYRGLTKERPLTAADHGWILPGQQLQSFAIGYYNPQGGYTIGQVFKDPDPALSDPSKAQFIDGAYVFKLLFAEHDPAKVDAASYPLDGAPQWQVQDVAAPNDPDVTASGVGTLDETWISPGIPAAFQNKLGRHGRLNGPVDNPVSSCISCHSTAQVSPGATPIRAFRGTRLIPPPACSDAQDMTWFRNLTGSQVFGLMTSNGDGCALAPAQPAALVSTDYSLQLADGLASSLFYRNPNPCRATARAMRAGDEADTGSDGASPGMARSHATPGPQERAVAGRSERVAMDPATMRAMPGQQADSDEASRR